MAPASPGSGRAARRGCCRTGSLSWCKAAPACVLPPARRCWWSCHRRVSLRSDEETAMQIDHPFHFDAHGRTATTDDVDHVRDMIELLLFTRPGERVNRPDFGSGLMHAVFAPNSPELATAIEFTTRAALQRHLGDVIEIQALTVQADDATLRVDLKYA